MCAPGAMPGGVSRAVGTVWRCHSGLGPNHYPSSASAPNQRHPASLTGNGGAAVPVRTPSHTQERQAACAGAATALHAASADEGASVWLTAPQKSTIDDSSTSRGILNHTYHTTQAPMSRRLAHTGHRHGFAHDALHAGSSGGGRCCLHACVHTRCAVNHA